MDELNSSTLFGILLGVLAGALSTLCIQKVRLSSFKHLAREILNTAQIQADKLLHTTHLKIKDWEMHQQQELDKAQLQREKQWHLEEERLKRREEKLDKQSELLERKKIDLQKKETRLSEKEQEIETIKHDLLDCKKAAQQRLEEICGFSADSAALQLKEQLIQDLRKESAGYINKIRQQTEKDAELEVKKIIASALQRISSQVGNEAIVTVVPLPNEEMKARIIGREGRNIRSFEMATGINLVIDDTPSAVVLSGFDPVRREVARLALLELIQDGRIHPTRIEESVQRAQTALEKQIVHWGEAAAAEIGAFDLHPELCRFIGSMKLRYSLGQNLLEHSLEVSYLMGIIASELGCDSKKARRMGLLHDIGKTAPHTIEGSHALIGYQLAKQYGETEEVANGIGCHHHEMQAATLEAELVSIADALSAKRIGARIEHIDQYLKRLKDLEALALQVKGVEKAHVLQAGREVRVFISSSETTEEEPSLLARQLANRIEKELRYPGKIKVLVIRETKAIQYAI